MTDNQIKLAKLIMALMKQDPRVSGADALAFVKYNKIPVVVEGEVIVSHQDLMHIMDALANVELPVTTTNIPDAVPFEWYKIGDTVKVGDSTGDIKEIRYQIDGLGNKYYKVDDFTKL